MMEKEGMFAKEVKIYRELLSQWPQSGDNFEPLFKWRPECYYTRSDLIVLEELEKGYRHLPFAGNYELPHCQEMLKALAKMHASSMNFEKVKLKGETMDKYFGHVLFNVALQEGNTWFNAGLELIYFIAVNNADHFKGVQLPEREGFLERLYEVFKFRNENDDFEKVFCHLDMWTSNQFFKYSEDGEPGHCILIDFQIANYKSPVLDLLTALHVTTRRKFREQKLSNCFDFYLTYFKETLKNVFKYTDVEVDAIKLFKKEEFDKLRRHYKLYSLIINCVFVPLTQLKPGTLMGIKRNDPLKYFNICNINRNEFTKEHMDTDPYYKEYVLEAVEELVEYLFK